MKTIPLRDVNGNEVAVAFVDDEDYDRLTRRRWSLMPGGAHRKVRVGGRQLHLLCTPARSQALLPVMDCWSSM